MTAEHSLFYSINPRTQQHQGEALRESTRLDIDAAVKAACEAAPLWAQAEADSRAGLLDALAAALENQREPLVALADCETALGSARLNGELDRTIFQLRGFADTVEAGEYRGILDEEAISGAPPYGRPHMTRLSVPLGPVAMFAASNFPFAFSVLGGDTASALAAGCPVVVKAHPLHPTLSLAVYELAQEVIARLGLPAGLLTLVQGPSHQVGITLAQHPAIAAVAFTGSYRGGVSLQQAINQRAKPIPFYGELGSINPVIALPRAVSERGSELAQTLAASIVQGSGQFCTSPGVLVLLENTGTQPFIDEVSKTLSTLTTHPMLSQGMRDAFETGVARLLAQPSARRLTSATSPTEGPTPTLIEVEMDAFLSNHTLREEVFGPVCVVLRASSIKQVLQVLHAIGGSLTVTLWGAEQDTAENRDLITAAMSIAGRVLFTGVPTGVAVTHAQLHGGPWPASTQPQTTSVGFSAMQRFLRPLALQDAPAWLLKAQGVNV